MVNQSQLYWGVSQVPGLTLSWGEELKKLSASWSLCWEGSEKVSENGFLLSFGNPLILAVSSFPVLGWIWFVFIKFSLLMCFFAFHWFHYSVFLFTLFPLKLISWEWKNVVLLVGSEWFVLMSWNLCWCCLFQSTLLLKWWFIHSMVNECLSSL